MPQGLTTKGAATRQRVIEGTAALMRRHGPDVSLDEVRAETRTSKSQLFHYFPEGRRHLLLAVAQHEADQVIAEQQPHLGALTSWADWLGWRDAVVEHYQRQGRQCALSVLISQLAPGDEQAAAVVTGLLERWRGLLAAGVAAMQQHGLMRGDIAAGRAADALLSGLQGGAITLIASGRIEPLEAALDVTLDCLRG
ncbi:MAG: TetR/AcrR family transcriptional regulator [Streptosporangiaceae bacterium]